MFNLVEEGLILNEQYDIVLHAAGKAHSVPQTDEEKNAFFDVNLQGTKNLCSALEKVGVPRALIFISTVAVYGCDFGENITEEHPLMVRLPMLRAKSRQNAIYRVGVTCMALH